ncbi:enoyl-CoA hydratase/isomerase family protein [Inhella gelatinilytica]|uniref:Enoyl-CoA hydratase/isomerase family protein n=1 Tax=Inhella gelatinilytica TaxID=2795030 RepID=A0A931IUL1_9BURK|nr:enoyl-CoA hydratase/isomerase family protein [Inhella gelatinilytica]MBH9551279.1 enoyl-CoA hydratase/isomerase family protein [Inhella gelatinilytica]
MTATLKMDVQGAVARVTLNRPDVRNAFNDAVIHELTRAFEDLGNRSDLRAIVLAAEGKAFCAGADLNWMRAMADYSWEENHQDAGRLAQMLWTIYRCPIPVIARVQGDVYAGGVGLVACADIVVSTVAAGFCLSEAKLGLLPATIGPYVVKALGERQARRYFTTAERFDAATAHRLGLVHEVVADAEALDAKVADLAAALCANGPAAVKACKKLALDMGAAPELTEALRDDTACRIADIRASAEGKSGVQSFLNKQPLPWLLSE